MDRTVDRAAAEGWNPGLGDAAAFRAADPEGFLVAVEYGEPVASISVVRYGTTHGFLGFYIVRPDKRGRGIGWRLWQTGMARLDGRTVGLDGVVDQQENYRRSGFAFAWRNIRYTSRTVASPPNAEAPQQSAEAGNPVTSLSGPPDEGTFAALAALDRRHFGSDRDAFLRVWLTAPGHSTALARETPDGPVVGYGVARPCREGVKIGPLFSPTPSIAEALLRALAAGLPEGTLVTLDCPEPNREAAALGKAFGFEPVFETARMYRGPAPEIDLSGVYGITSFELG